MIINSISYFNNDDLINLISMTEFQRYDYLLKIMPMRFRECNDIDDDNEFYIIINDMIDFYRYIDK